MILQHGTLLFTSKLPDLSNALKINPLKYSDKAVKSVRSRVTNISEHIEQQINLEEFERLLIVHVHNLYDDSEIYELTTTDVEAIDNLVKNKYNTWDWNYGNSPKYNFQKGIKTSGGHIEVNLEVSKGIIKKIKIFGDFFNTEDIRELESFLEGKPHSYDELSEELKSIELSTYMSNVTVDEFLEGLI